MVPNSILDTPRKGFSFGNMKKLHAPKKKSLRDTASGGRSPDRRSLTCDESAITAFHDTCFPTVSAKRLQYQVLGLEGQRRDGLTRVPLNTVDSDLDGANEGLAPGHRAEHPKRPFRDGHDHRSSERNMPIQKRSDCILMPSRTTPSSHARDRAAGSPPRIRSISHADTTIRSHRTESLATVWGC